MNAMDAGSADEGAAKAKAKARGRTAMIEGQLAVQSLFEEALDENADERDTDEDYFTKMIQASKFAQTSMAAQMDALASAATTDEYAAVEAYIAAVDWSKTELFEPVSDKIEYDAYVATDGGKKKDMSEDVSSLVEVLEDNLVYIAAGASTLFLVILFVVSRKLRRDRQLVKEYDDSEMG